MNIPPTRIIISVGGSLIVPDEIDTDFLTKFHTIIVRAIAQGFSFFIIAGGGKTARRYQDAARSVRGDLTRDDLDWLGTHATRINAHLLRTLFREEADPHIITNIKETPATTAPVLIGAGSQPGRSTDYCAVIAANTLKAKKIVNLSNIDYVYTADPRIDKDAAPIKEISWSDFRALIPKEWDPGLSSPFDPIAAKEAERLGLEVAIMNGGELDNLKQYLSNERYTGTIIS